MAGRDGLCAPELPSRLAQSPLPETRSCPRSFSSGPEAPPVARRVGSGWAPAGQARRNRPRQPRPGGIRRWGGTGGAGHRCRGGRRIHAGASFTQTPASAGARWRLRLARATAVAGGRATHSPGACARVQPARRVGLLRQPAGAATPPAKARSRDRDGGQGGQDSEERCRGRPDQRVALGRLVPWGAALHRRPCSAVGIAGWRGDAEQETPRGIDCV